MRFFSLREVVLCLVEVIVIIGEKKQWGYNDCFGSWTAVIFLDKKWEVVCVMFFFFCWFFLSILFLSLVNERLVLDLSPPLFQDCWCFYEEERLGFWSFNDLENQLKARFRRLIQFRLYLLDNSL
jgi:hypothetical protein